MKDYKQKQAAALQVQRRPTECMKYPSVCNLVLGRCLSNGGGLFKHDHILSKIDLIDPSRAP